jgi:hypothetical protein
MTRSVTGFLMLALATPLVWAGPCVQGDAQVKAAAGSWNLLARFDQGDASGLADGRVPAPASAPVAVEVDAYMRFHAEIASSGARSLLMPWPELRSLIQ